MEVCTPTGARCCQNFYEDSGKTSTWMRVDECAVEFRLLHDGKLDPLMSPADHADVYSKVKDLMAKARAGSIDFFSRRPEAKDIQMIGYTHVVELIPKPGARATFGRTARLVRVYFVEPLWLSDKLVALHVASKDDGPDPVEQNEAIREAGNRADAWALYSMQLTTGG